MAYEHMMDALIEFTRFCFSFIPTSVKIGILTVLCIGTVLFVVFCGFKKGLKWSTALLLFVYLFLLVSLTIVFREIPGNIHLVPFGIFRAILEGNSVFLTQAVMNMAAFVPLGVLLGCLFSRIKWWKVLLISGAISILIEVFQFVLKRGFAESDDVLHNVIGCMIGYGLYVGIASLVKCVAKKRIVCKIIES